MTASTSPTAAAGPLVVVTVDQRASRSGPDLLDAARDALNRDHGAVLERAFERTAGDEMQAVSYETAWLPDLVLGLARTRSWWIGIGLGGFEAPLRPTARESRGEAFYLARDAVEQAKRRPWGFALAGAGLADAEDCLAMLAYLVVRRTDAQHEAATLFRRLGSRKAVAEALGISPPSAGDRLRGAAVEEEAAGRRLAERLLDRAAAGA
jgi:ribosomal protein S18 acetylase RimI-like enzyme